MNEVKQIGATFYMASRTGLPNLLKPTVSDNKTAPAQITVELRNSGGNWATLEAFQVSSGDGEKTIEARFTDELGNESEPVQVTFVLDTTPPQISHTPVELANQTSNVSIEMDVTDDSPITGRVMSRLGSDSNFTPIEMTGDTRLKTEIPSAALKFGLSYYLEVEDALGHKSTFPQTGELNPIGVVVSGEFTPDSAFIHDVWNLFSVPLLADNTDLAVLLDSAAGPNNWRAGTWNGTANISISPAAEPGKSFWLISRQTLNPPQLKVNGKTAKPSATHTIGLRQGWNSVANPFLFPVVFGNLRVETTDGPLPLDKQDQETIRPRFWRRTDALPNDSVNVDYEMVEDGSAGWNPWSGYWIYANSAATLHIEPFIQLVEATPTAPPRPLLDWLATLSVRNGRDVSRVRLALSKGAGWGYDLLDVEQPPSPTKIFVSLLQDGMHFQRIALPLEAEEWVWEAELNAGEGTTLVLADAPLAGHHLYLERSVDGSRIELLPHQSVPVSDGHHRVRIRLTKQILGWDVLDAVPTVTQLFPNYPNPFNPETWIPFTLSEEGVVEITIYDVVGRGIRRLSLGMLPPGRYSEKGRAAYWDGRNQAGESVASAAYFVVLKTKGYQQARRIVLLK